MRLNNKAVMATDTATKTSRVWFVLLFCILLKVNSLTIVFVLYHIANPLEDAIILTQKKKISYHKFPADSKLKRKRLVNISRDENKYFQLF